MLEDMLPLGMTMDAVILGMAGLSAGLVVFAVWNALVVRDPMAARVKALAERRAALKAGLTAPSRTNSRRQKSLNFVQRVMKSFNMKRDARTANLQMRLARAGYRSKDAPMVFMFFKFVMPVVVGLAAAILVYVLNFQNLSPNMKLVVCFGGLLLGFYGPDLFINNAATKRQHKLRKGLPDGIDLLVICAEAGLGMDAAFSRVGKEMAKACPELSDELGLTALELSFLPERRQALDNLAQRTNMSELRAVVNTLMQSEKYGTPLAHSLRVLSAEFRNERMLRAEEKAAKLPATLTVPMIVFILPTLFIVILGPAVLRMIDNLGPALSGG